MQTIVENELDDNFPLSFVCVLTQNFINYGGTKHDVFRAARRLQKNRKDEDTTASFAFRHFGRGERIAMNGEWDLHNSCDILIQILKIWAKGKRKRKRRIES